MKLLIVGASGFIGKNLLASRSGDEVVATYNSADGFPAFATGLAARIATRRCDLRDESAVKRLFQEFRDFDRCVYLACDTRVGYLTSNQPEDVQNNIRPMANFVKHYSGGPTVFFSSGAVYMGQKGPVSQEKVRPTIPYAISKLASELYLAHGTGSSGYVIVRFFGAYGPHEAERKITRKLLQAIGSAREEVEFTVYGNGENLIDVMHVDDAVKAIGKILEAKTRNLTVDLCGGTAMTLNDYVERIVRLHHKRPKVTHTGSSPEYIEFFASNDSFQREFGYTPTTSLEEGVTRYGKWLGSTGVPR